MSQDKSNGHPAGAQVEGWERAVSFLWGEAERDAAAWPSRDAGRVWRDLFNGLHGMAVLSIWQGMRPDVIEALELLRAVAYERARMAWAPAGRAAA